jgi:ketosteroid isomerase-like protein
MRLSAVSPIILLSVFVAACRPASRSAGAQAEGQARDSIAATMDRYMVAARSVDAAAMASFFTPTGVLFEPGIPPIQTPDSIRAFIGSFPGVRVDSATAVADTIEVFGHTALLWGSYFERLAFPGQPISEQEGRFVIEWVQHEVGHWLIHRYYRIPLPGTKQLAP